MTATLKDLNGVINWTKDYFDNAGIKKAVIGLSGGIDSAVIASLCCRALGRENVIGIVMPCQSQLRDQNYAEKLIQSLGLNDINDEFRSQKDNSIYFQMDEIFEKFWKDYLWAVQGEDCIPDTYGKLVPANIKARLRMTALYAVAGHVGGLVVGTTNKTEMMIGYATKHGDHGVDIEPIQDFYKGEVYELAEMLADIPQEIIDRAPSAGLWDDQTDEGELGMTYASIDRWLMSREYYGANSKKHPSNEKTESLIAAAQHKQNPNMPYYKRNETSNLPCGRCRIACSSNSLAFEICRDNDWAEFTAKDAVK